MDKVKIGRTVYDIIHDYSTAKCERYRVMSIRKRDVVIYDLVRENETLPWELEKVTDNIRKPAGWRPGNVRFL